MLRAFNVALVVVVLGLAFVLYSLEHRMRAGERAVAGLPSRSPRSARRSGCSRPNGAFLPGPSGSSGWRASMPAWAR
jgi:hypothetical protein